MPHPRPNTKSKFINSMVEQLKTDMSGIDVKSMSKRLADIERRLASLSVIELQYLKLYDEYRSCTCKKHRIKQPTKAPPLAVRAICMSGTDVSTQTQDVGPSDSRQYPSTSEVRTRSDLLRENAEMRNKIQSLSMELQHRKNPALPGEERRPRITQPLPLPPSAPSSHRRNDVKGDTTSSNTAVRSDADMHREVSRLRSQLSTKTSETERLSSETQQVKSRLAHCSAIMDKFPRDLNDFEFLLDQPTSSTSTTTVAPVSTSRLADKAPSGLPHRLSQTESFSLDRRASAGGTSGFGVVTTRTRTLSLDPLQNRADPDWRSRLPSHRLH